MKKVYSRIESIKGNVISVRATDVAYGELAEVTTRVGVSLAEVHRLEEDLVSLDTVATAGYHDKLSGNLFLQIGASIYQWDSDASSPLTMTYKTKAERVPYQCCMACGMVLAKEYPVTFRLYGDGVLRKTVIVENGDPFWMKGGYLAREYEIEVSGTNEVIWFGAGESIEDVWGAVANGI